MFILVHKLAASNHNLSIMHNPHDREHWEVALVR